MMRPMSSASRRRAGFTLIELMLAVTLLGIVMYMTLDSLTRQQKTSIVTDQIVEVQNNVRAVASLLEREIRMAGFMVPNAVGVCGVDRTTGTDELFVSETEPFVPDAVLAGDLGARLGASSWAASTAPPASSSMPSQPGTGTAVNGILLDPATTNLDGDAFFFYDNDENGTAEADFRVGGGFILGDLSNPHRGSVCGRVTAVTATQISIRVRGGQLDAHLPTSDAPEEIVIVPAAHYWVNSTFTTGRFERNGDLLANGIDDFQISYFFDVDDDGTIDAGENPGSLGTTYTADSRDVSSLKAVNFSLVLRTRAADPNFNEGLFRAFENRSPIVGNDSFRRRVIVGGVRPRNIGNQGSI